MENKKTRFVEESDLAIKDTGWMIISKEIVKSPIQKTLDRQLRDVPNGRRISNAVEILYAISAYYKINNVRLFKYSNGFVNKPDLAGRYNNIFKGTFVATSSVDNFGRRVFVGHNNKRLKINRFYKDSIKSRGAGVAYIWDFVPQSLEELDILAA